MRRTRATLVAVAAGALVLTACSSGGGGGDSTGENKDAKAKQSKSAQQLAGQITFGDDAASKGPAEPVPGAVSGGTMNVLERDSYTHLDPAQIYVQNEGQLATLIHRGLTTYKLDNKGTYTVVGDLATNSGEQSDGGKTWTFHLKDGIKFSDGTPITSKDIRWSVERMFAPFVTNGPVYLQQWLANVSGTDYRKLLPDGPYKGKHLPDSLLATPDAKTVVFHFAKPQTDAPYLFAMPGYSVVDSAKDTQLKYDKAPVASGPYMIKSFDQGKSMSLVKNPNWDPNSDPARHQYVDGFAITFNHQFEDSTKRLMSDSGENQNSVSFSNPVDTDNTPTVVGTPAIYKRTVAGYQPFVGQIDFNMKKVTDLNVRKALALAIPTKPVYQALGATYGAEYAGGYISPALAGYQKADPLGKVANPNGDQVAAKKILTDAGKLNTKITYAYVNSTQGQQYSVAIAAALKAAGFDVQRKELPSDTYYDLIGKVDNPYDIYSQAWGADWPSALTVIPPVFDGRTISDQAPNYSHVNDPHINSEIDRISAITDPQQAQQAWFALNTYILTKVIPAVPTVYYKQLQLFGSKVGGAVYNNMFSGIDATKLYLKK
ncbi:ABC transporter substrate-binding protein [Streptomyces sp. NBC_01477]|uniref:ABC transporter substrate-binding protein n=1 Tax=Streptomyces sp. NBC_01477 TaxID=2976015 RepID=UPI002E371025|nr:ABC transporter substrate-binding protein [Streptomyces sp. NBC_01477]